jgi:isopenicillin N synthase-like dioxygenase
MPLVYRIAGLKIPSEEGEGKWEWVKPKDNAIICNVGQALEALSAGLFKAALHRVHDLL